MVKCPLSAAAELTRRRDMPRVSLDVTGGSLPGGIEERDKSRPFGDWGQENIRQVWRGVAAAGPNKARAR
ncbi:hypothetical protein HPB52_017516 [Rhipicephalus sanguineus]|uniref:Uncharacterized protein n=1 Tax=Rhipicephalus sanguineus TaxID=34632 RepID=A0A9D4PDD3_RHISA|nr:hypothetical protein HPB52_017516 [Rhipicephalus sanguineus]